MALEGLLGQLSENEYCKYESRVEFSCSTLCVQIKQDFSAVGSFSMISDNENPQDISIIVDNDYLKISRRTPQESGVTYFDYYVENKAIGYTDKIEGKIIFATNIGEYILPYNVTKLKQTLDYEGGTIATLEEFARIVEDNIDEATKIFYSREAKDFFEAFDEDILAAYNAYAYYENNTRNIEEFLIEIGLRDRVSFLISEKTRVINVSELYDRQYITITKIGDGKLNIDLMVEGDFITLNTMSLTEDNFLGDECELEFFIDNKKITTQNSRARIILKSVLCKEILEIGIEGITVDKAVASRELQNKIEISKLYRGYIEFRLKIIDHKAWFDKSLDRVEGLIDNDPNSMKLRMFQVQLLLAANRRNEAKWILDFTKNKIEEQDESVDLYCYYLYLTTILTGDDIDIEMAAEKINFYYERNPSWWIAWLMTYMNESIRRDLERKYELLLHHVDGGCNSPIVYAEILNIYLKRPDLLESLENSELNILNFASKYNLITDELVERIKLLSQGNLEYSTLMMKVLMCAYEASGDNDLLSTICGMFIREDKNSENYHKWYALGVQNQVRVTNLYEYYIMSMHIVDNACIERQALVYFAYSDTLHSRQKPMLYKYILTSEDDDLRDMYVEQIRAYVKMQISYGNMSGLLSYIYEEIVDEDLLDEETVEDFAKIIFKKEITNIPTDIVKLIVVHPYIHGEIVYDCTGNSVIVSMYDKNAKIYLQDIYGNRYKGDKCVVNELLDVIKWCDTLIIEGVSNPYLDWYIINEREKGRDLDIDTASALSRMIENEYIMLSWKQIYRKKLAEYYYDNDMIEELDELILNVDLMEIHQSEYDAIFSLLVKRGLYEKAYELIQIKGVDGLSPTILIRLSKRLMSGQISYEKEDITAMVFYAYNNKVFDQVTLSYLAQNYYGGYDDMLSIYENMQIASDDTQVLERKILEYAMLCKINNDVTDRIFSSLLGTNNNDEILSIYLIYSAHLFLLDRRRAGKLIEECWTEYIESNEFEPIIAIALVKSMVGNNRTLTQYENTFIGSMISKLGKEKKCLAYMNRIVNVEDYIKDYNEYEVIEYKAKYSNQVYLYYDDAKKEDRKFYRKLELRPVIGQLYVVTFLLFFGDDVDYYIAELKGDEEVITQKGTISVSDVTTKKQVEKYELINDMQVAYTLHENLRFEKLANDYMKKEFMASKLFQLR